MAAMAFAAFTAFTFTPSVPPNSAALRHPIVCMRHSWVPPPRGTPGTPISGSFGEEQAMVERAAAAENAGIDGYMPDSQAVKKTASAASSGAESVTDFDVLTYDGTHTLAITERVDMSEPITDIWTFGTERSTSSPARDNEVTPMSLFEKLKNALPKLALDKFHMK